MTRTRPLPIQEGLELPARELHLAFARAGGPGGQNVNKVETKATIRFSVVDSPTLSPEQRARIAQKLGARLSTNGELIVASTRFRERERNIEDARERLAELLRRALHVPRPRRATRPTRGSVERRRTGKNLRSKVKKSRSGDFEA